MQASVTTADIQQKPWKYVGYPGYSAFVASDTDFFILRRFSVANARIALLLQDRVSQTVEDLEKVDELCSQKDGKDVDNGSFRTDIEARTELLEELQSRLNKYSEQIINGRNVFYSPFTDIFILQQYELKKFAPALSHDIESLRTRLQFLKSSRTICRMIEILSILFLKKNRL